MKSRKPLWLGSAQGDLVDPRVHTLMQVRAAAMNSANFASGYGHGCDNRTQSCLHCSSQVIAFPRSLTPEKLPISQFGWRLSAGSDDQGAARRILRRTDADGSGADSGIWSKASIVMADRKAFIYLSAKAAAGQFSVLRL